VREVVNAPNRPRLPRNKKKVKKNNKQFTKISLYGHTHRQDKINRITGSDITIYQWKSRKKPAGKTKKEDYILSEFFFEVNQHPTCFWCCVCFDDRP
jgi:hypothetical protein